MHTKKAALKRCEWDFSACSDDDRSACVQYEYAREFLHKQPNLTSELIGDGRAKHLIRFLSFLFTSGKQCSDYFPILSDRFPATPWLELSCDERMILREFRNKDSQLLAPEKWELECLSNFAKYRQKQLGDWQEQAMQWVETNGHVGGRKMSFADLFASCPHFALTPTHLYRYFGGRDYALIVLDWSKSKNDLRAAFEELLQWAPPTFPGALKPSMQRAGNARTPFRRAGGRGGPVDQLRHLGALRLKTHYEKTEDVVRFLDGEMSDLPHQNGRSIDNAVGKARATLRKMEKDGRFSVLFTPK